MEETGRGEGSKTEDEQDDSDSVWFLRTTGRYDIIWGKNNWGNLSNLGGKLESLSIGPEFIVWASCVLRIY